MQDEQPLGFVNSRKRDYRWCVEQSVQDTERFECDMAATVEPGNIVLDTSFAIGRAMITYPSTQQSTTKKREEDSPP